MNIGCAGVQMDTGCAGVKVLNFYKWILAVQV
jgi:hypothetical protein